MTRSKRPDVRYNELVEGPDITVSCGRCGEEMEHVPVDDVRRAAFLDQQFAAQFEHYGIHYPTCERNIIENGFLNEFQITYRLSMTTG